MKSKYGLLALVLAFSIEPSARLQATTTIDSVNKYSYGANIGWEDWTGDTANGVVLGQFFCSGYIYAANVGWISLGNGAPANQIQYQNNSASDFGVNHDGSGNLRGYGYGANIGWLNFESQGAPKIDLLTGNLSGYVWSANCGWISLNNAQAYVQTDTLSPGPLDSNGLPIAWELTYFGHTGVDSNADPDGDGMSNYQEYVAGTDPTSANSDLYISAIAEASGPTVTLTWKSTPTRLYYILRTSSLAIPVWEDSGLGLISPNPGSTTTRSFTDTTGHYYRIKAVIPPGP